MENYKEKIVLEFMKAVAPTIVNAGLTLQTRVIEAGGSPNCKVGNKDIPHAYAESALIWAKAFADEYINGVIKKKD